VSLEGVLDSAPIVITPYSPNTPPYLSIDALAAAGSGQGYVVVTAGIHGGVAIAGINASGIVTVLPQLVSSSMSADTPAVSCAANGCSVTWHWAGLICTSLCAGPENPYDVVANTDAAGNIISYVPLNDSADITPARSVASADGKSIFVYSNGTTMFAGRITAAGVALDTRTGRRVISSETSFALQPVAVVGTGLYFIEPDDATTGRLYWTRIDPEPVPHATSLVDLHQSVLMPVGFSDTRTIPLTASARNTYLIYAAGDDDATLMAPRLFLRTLDSPDPQTSTPRKRAAR